MSRSSVTMAADNDSFEVAGRGELQLGRAHRDPAPRRLRAVDQPPARPVPRRPQWPRGAVRDRASIDVDDEFSGTVIDKMALRKGEMTDMRPSGGGKTRLTFSAPSRGLIGYHGEFLSDTRGTGIMNRLFERYGPYKGPIQGRQNGVLISMEQGKAVAYALNTLEERGVLFVSPGDDALRRHGHRRERQAPGPRGQPAKVQAADQLPRQSGPKDEGIRLTPPRRMTPGAGDRLHPGRRAGRSHAQGGADPEAVPRPA